MLSISPAPAALAKHANKAFSAESVMFSRWAAGIFHRSAVFNCRICFLVHLTIRPPESDSQSESYCAPSREPEKRQKSLDSNSYGSGMTGPKRPVVVVRDDQFHCQLDIGNFNIRSYDKFRQRLIRRINLVSVPNDRASKPLLYHVLPAYFVKHSLQHPTRCTHVLALRR